MGKEHTHGQMVEDIKDNISTIKSRYLRIKLKGFGIYEWSDGRRYEGDWYNGKQHGRGLYMAGEVERIGEWVGGRRVRWEEESKSNYKKK